ncbi:MAG: L-histidine N(alpha)-methyltransferase [Candidatus Cloacimonadota bacterium]|nr:MAG: L-histidine N(alpha)-methyltransferase [Candidatus Cloacimonadota bacterium]
MSTQMQDVLHNETIDEVINGLSKPQKSLPSKLFYDEKGSKLFDEICELEEYYPTRTEIKILSNNIEEIASYIGDECLLVELGSGSSVKIRLLIDHLPTLTAYVPVDISSEHLLKSVDNLKVDHEELVVHPLVADYTKDFSLPKINESFKTIDAFYPGSTIGNFTHEEVKSFLNRIATTCGKESGLLIGVDLKKDPNILNAAYNDKKNITAEFNLNILNHLNNLLSADFNLNKFKHHAFNNEEFGRIEMHLVSNEKQDVQIEDYSFSFEKDETILTEYSYKYSLEDFKQIASGIYKVEKVWVDENSLFSIQFLRAL